jgi:2-dehydropantoate 2-reductase
MLEREAKVVVKVGIVGSGAVGLLMAAKLSSKYDVTIYTRRQSQAILLNNAGLRMITDGEEETIFIKAKPFQCNEIDEDVVFITVKQYHLPELLSQRNRLQDVETVIFMQNGMGHLELLGQLKNKNILLGVVEHGALKHDDRTVEHTGKGKIIISVWKGEMGHANRFVDELASDFPFVYSEEWYEMLAMKLAINAVVNPLTALLRVKNGGLLQVNEYKAMMELLFREVKEVLSLSDQLQAWEKVVSVCQNTANNRSSMLKDIERGCKTEVDAILGYIIEKGRRMNIPTPLSEFLYYAIKGIEQGGSRNE